MRGFYRRSSLPNVPAGLRRVEGVGPWELVNGEELVPEVRKIPRRRGLIVFHGKVASLADLQQEAQLASVIALKASIPPIIKELQLLRAEEEPTEEPITHHAYSIGKEILEYAHAMLGDEFPQPHLAPDGIGGIRMEWFKGRTNVRAVMPPLEDQRMYIYQMVDGIPQVKELSAAALVNTLRSHILA